MFKRKQVLATRGEAEKDGIVVPQTLEEYCVKSSKENNDQNEDCILDDLDDLDPFDNNDDENDLDYDESNTDSGNEES
jgi:ubiquitin-conjugating enzyme E2 R